MKIRHFSRMMGVVILVFAICLGYFVDEVKPNSVCVCNDTTLKASIALDDCRCQYTVDCMGPFWTNSESTEDLVESAINVTISPFSQSFKAYPNLPAFNITFDINDEKITGLTFLLQKGCLENAPRCRFFDFNSYRSSLRNAVFFSEEFFFKSPWGNSCTVEVKGLNNKLVPIYHRKFLTKVPDIESLELDCARLSRWQSFVTLDQSSYKEETMRIAFTAPPKNCNVTSFKIMLIENNEVKSSEIWEENTYRPIIYKQLCGIRPGVTYKVEISINDTTTMLCNGPCTVSSSSFFSFDVQDSGVHVLIIVFIVTSILLVTLIACIILMRRRKPSNYEIIKVFIAYSFDIEQHSNVIKQFAEYLKKYCFCDVKLDIWDVVNRDPHLWVNECITNADYVLIVWSRGAQLKMCKDNTRRINEPGYLGNDLFSTAMTKITSKINKELRTPQYWRNLRKFVNISFPYVPSSAIPTQFDYLPFFKLPSSFNAFLCHIHGFAQSPFPFSLIPSLFSCCRCYPLLQFSDLNKSKEGESLLRAIGEMNKLEMQGDWLPHLPPDMIDDDSSPTPDDSEDDSNRQSDTFSVKSEQSENQEHYLACSLPIFGPKSCDDSEALPDTIPPDMFLSNCVRRSSLDSSHFDPADDPLIGENQMDLPLGVFGPDTFAPHK